MSDTAPPPTPPAFTVPRRSFDTLDDAAEAFAAFREERKQHDTFVREQLADIKTALDLILKTLAVDEEQEERASV